MDWVMPADLPGSGLCSQGTTDPENQDRADVALQNDGRAGMVGAFLKPILAPMKRLDFHRRQVKR